MAQSRAQKADVIARLARDPLAHFLLLGAILWLVMAWRGEPADPASRAVTITRERQAMLAANFEQLMARPPTERELAGLIATEVREEILVREALRLGLDQDDPVIRRRLATKMDELAAAEAESAMPSDKVLAQWQAAHPERFAGETRLTFAQHVFASEAEARDFMSRGAAAQPRHHDEMDLPTRATRMPAKEVARTFGMEFAAGLAKLAPARGWQGPIPSGLGWHAVRLEARDVQDVPKLAAIRDRVIDDWRSSTMAARRAEGYRLLAKGYKVTVAR